MQFLKVLDEFFITLILIIIIFEGFFLGINQSHLLLNFLLIAFSIILYFDLLVKLFAIIIDWVGLYLEFVQQKEISSESNLNAIIGY